MATEEDSGAGVVPRTAKPPPSKGGLSKGTTHGNGPRTGGTKRADDTTTSNGNGKQASGGGDAKAQPGGAPAGATSSTRPLKPSLKKGGSHNGDDTTSAATKPAVAQRPRVTPSEVDALVYDHLMARGYKDVAAALQFAASAAAEEEEQGQGQQASHSATAGAGAAATDGAGAADKAAVPFASDLHLFVQVSWGQGLPAAIRWSADLHSLANSPPCAAHTPRHAPAGQRPLRLGALHLPAASAR